MTCAAPRPKALITGTPGVGKTTHCRKIAEVLKSKCVTVGEILANTPYVIYIPKLATYEIIDLASAAEIVRRAVGPGDVVDTHVVELSPDPEAVVVLRKAPDVLFRELVDRGWPLKKVLDNVWAEMLDVVYVKAREKWSGAVQIDVTKRSHGETFEAIRRCVVGDNCIDEAVDWLSYAERTGFLDFIERLSRWWRSS